MGMRDYTAPLFGSVDFTPWTPPAVDIFQNFQVTYRASATKKNSKGQVYQGDIFATRTEHILNISSRGMQSETCLYQANLRGETDKPIAILALPITYGNASDTSEGSLFGECAWAVGKYHETKSFCYIIVYRNRGASLGVNMPNRTQNGKYYTSIQSIFGYEFNPPTGYAIEPTIDYKSDAITRVMLPKDEENTTYSGRLFYSYIGLVNELNRINSEVSRNSFSADILKIPTEVIARLATLFGAWKVREDSVIGEIDFMFLYSQMTGFGDGVCDIGCTIATGLPVFTLDSFDQLVKYFQDEPYIADNDDVPEDWSTKWDIYIKGAQKPDIFITMKSEAVDRWLESEDNTSGISKGDIKVEYKYPNYGDPTSAQPAPVNVLYPSDPVFINWLKDNYNITRETSYNEILSLNYNLVEQIILANEFREGDVIQYQYYAQLYFRIAYGTYRSAWCRFKIGFIGSPTVPDFSQMENEGIQDDEVFFDNSTVTLHYDEFPPNYNPYPDTPLPDMPVPGGTDPTPVPPGLNGIGLLSTTYKITPDNAKALGRFFWGGDLFQKIKALNTSPIENVVGMTIMPIDIQGSTSVIMIGDVNTTINGDKITSVPLYTVGSVEIKGRYQSFMDFEPYTSAFIFLPFVGFVQIDPVYFTNKTLSVVYSYDLISGLCNAMLFSDGIYVESHQGTCGIEVPLIASNRAELAIGLATSLVTSAAIPASAALSGGKNVAKNVAKSGLSGAMEGAGGVVDFITGFHSTRQGSYSPACAWTETRECFIVIESANGAHTSSYNHDKGRPCNATYSIGALKGFTIVDPSVDLSGLSGATEEEVAMIREYLTTGFYA